MTVFQPITVIAEGTCCACCYLILANDDRSSCADYYGHESHEPMLPEGVESGQLIAGDGESEVTIGPCELCREGESGYMEGYPYAVLSR